MACELDEDAAKANEMVAQARGVFSFQTFLKINFPGSNTNRAFC